MNGIDLLARKKDMLESSIEAYSNNDNPDHKALVINWENELVDCMTYLDLRDLQDEKISLKVELEGGRASEFDVEAELLKSITQEVNNLLNTIIKEAKAESAQLHTQVESIDNCCTLLTLDVSNSTNPGDIKSVNQSISHLINSLNMIKERNNDLNVYYLDDSAIMSLEKLLKLMEENSFELKVSAETNSGFHKEAEFKLDLTSRILDNRAGLA